MMELSKPPTPKTAWGITWAAILELLAFGFLIAGGAGFSLLVLFGACEAIFIFLAVKGWKEYFEAYTQSEIAKAADATPPQDIVGEAHVAHRAK